MPVDGACDRQADLCGWEVHDDWKVSIERRSTALSPVMSKWY